MWPVVMISKKRSLTCLIHFLVLVIWGMDLEVKYLNADSVSLITKQGQWKRKRWDFRSSDRLVHPVRGGRHMGEHSLLLYLILVCLHAQITSCFLSGKVERKVADTFGNPGVVSVTLLELSVARRSWILKRAMETSWLLLRSYKIHPFWLCVSIKN